LKIAVDAMGGDHAPRAVVEGMALAISDGGVPRENLLLVGQAAALAPLIDEVGLEGVAVEDASQSIGMDESPASAIRGKRDSSIVRGMRTVAEGRAQAFISAGNTGAVVAASALVLGRLAGVSRPGIAVPVPTHRGPCVVIDVGANIYCKPDHMLQYAVMASEYCKASFGRADPVVGLLNIGEEEGKGNPLIQQVHALLQGSGVTYRGFIEGQDIMSGVVDVVVCEGFVGNVILKVAEGFSESFLHDIFRKVAETTNGSPDVKAYMGSLKQRFDYAATGGAPLLGVEGSIIICHGRSHGGAIANAIQVATNFTRSRVNERIVDEVAKVSMLHRVADFFHIDQN